MNEFKQIESIIATLQTIINSMKTSQPNPQVIQDVTLTVNDLNNYFYHTVRLKFQKDYDLNNHEEYALFIKELELLIDTWRQTMAHRELPDIDAQFWDIYEFFKYVDADIIYNMVVNKFLQMPEQYLEQYTRVELYPFMCGLAINYKTQNYSLIKRCVDLLSTRYDDYKWLYEHLGDYRSKAILNGIFNYWFTFDFDKLFKLNETVYSDYYDYDIVRFNPNAVIADLGAYTGDSALDYARIYKKFNKIYAYEITPSTFNKLTQNVSAYPNIIPVNKGVASTSGTMYVEGSDLFAGNKLSSNGNIAVEVVTLDDDIQEPVSIIKMDIEGAEKDALLGAKRHITEDKPQLLISAYHVIEDIFDIPRIINDIRDDYTYYLRYNGKNNMWSVDYVVFAI